MAGWSDRSAGDGRTQSGGQARGSTRGGAGRTGADTHADGGPMKRYRIGEVMQHSGLSRQTIHNYTVMGLIQESTWTDGGHRLYDLEVFARLSRIKALKSCHRLRDVKRILAGGKDAP